MLKLASLSDIPAIKKVAQRYTKELGFILRPALEAAVLREELLYEPTTGAFCHYHTRRDGTTVIYEICVPSEARGKGVGRQMVNMLPLPVELKCPLDNESNNFYEHMGFRKVRVDPGKKRQLNVWRLDRRG